MEKKQLKINSKKLSTFLILAFLILIPLGFYNYNRFGNEIDYLKFENGDLQNQIEDLESENNDLENKLSDLTKELKNSESSYERLSELYKEFLNTEMRVNEFNSNNYRDYNTTNPYESDYNQKSYNTYTIPSTLTTQYFEGGYIIKPSFDNLHCLLSITPEEFRNKMVANNYSLSTDKESYVSDGATYCCYTIKKEYDNVSMYFSKIMESDIQGFMLKNKINYTYDNGFKKYSYRVNNQGYEIHYKEASGYLGLIIKRT